MVEMNSTHSDGDSLVSVIMPFRDTAEVFLREAVGSVVRQTHPWWELMLVDDGSAEAATRCARTLVDQGGGRIRYLDHPGHRNRGSSASRNLGIRESRGKFVAFLDADDVWVKSKLEEQLAMFAAHPEIAMLYGNTRYWYSWNPGSEVTRRDYLPSLGLETPQVIDPPTLLTLSLRGRIAVPCTSSVMLRRDALGSERWFEDQFSGMYDEQIFYAKVWVTRPVCVVADCWDWYRQHPGSMTAEGSKTAAHDAARRQYLRWVRTYLAARNVTDRGLWNALRGAERALDGRWPRLWWRCRRALWRLMDAVP
jgi:glycosyltransferase involved in cell wall biosynthesis